MMIIIIMIMIIIVIVSFYSIYNNCIRSYDDDGDGKYMSLSRCSREYPLHE